MERNDSKPCFSGNYLCALTLAATGGFLEAYTYVTRDGIFANAQTGNIARFGVCMASGDYMNALRYFIPVMAFVFGVILSLAIKKRVRECRQGISLETAALPVEIIFLIIVGFVPGERYDGTATLIIAFVCAVQSGTFREFEGHKFASTMCTGNLRSGTDKLCAFFDGGDRNELKLALKYYLIDIVFAAGVIIGYRCTEMLYCRAVWCAAAVLVMLEIYLCAKRRNALN